MYYDLTIDQERIESQDAALRDWVSILGQLPLPTSAVTLDENCTTKCWELLTGNDGRIAPSCSAKYFAQTCAADEF